MRSVSSCRAMRWKVSCGCRVQRPELRGQPWAYSFSKMKSLTRRRRENCSVTHIAQVKPYREVAASQVCAFGCCPRVSCHHAAMRARRSPSYCSSSSATDPANPRERNVKRSASGVSKSNQNALTCGNSRVSHAAFSTPWSTPTCKPYSEHTYICGRRRTCGAITARSITRGISHLHRSENQLVRLYILPQSVIFMLWLACRSCECIYQEVIDLRYHMEPCLCKAHAISRVKVLPQEGMSYADNLGCNAFRQQQALHLPCTCNTLL